MVRWVSPKDYPQRLDEKLNLEAGKSRGSQAHSLFVHVKQATQPQQTQPTAFIQIPSLSRLQLCPHNTTTFLPTQA